MMLHTIYQTLGLVVSGKKIFSCFPYISLYKTCDEGGGEGEAFRTSGALFEQTW